MEKKEFYFYILTSGKAIYEAFAGIRLGKTEHAELIFPTCKLRGLTKYFYNLRFSVLFSKYLSWIPYKNWNKYHVLNDIHLNPSFENVIVFAPGLRVEQELNRQLLEKFKLENKVKMVLLLFDSIGYSAEGGWNDVQKYFDLFDVVMTFDSNDARNYNLHHFNLPYDFCINDLVKENFEKSDLFFVGCNKKRDKLIEDICMKAREKGVSTDVTIVDKFKLLKRLNLTELPYRYSGHRLDYMEVLNKVCETNCILEVLCEGQNEASLRYYEAITFNKKLLTNNASVVEMPFFNEKFMRVFNNPEQIDYDWLKKEENVDYHYDFRYGVVPLLNQISKLLMDA